MAIKLFFGKKKIEKWSSKTLLSWFMKNNKNSLIWTLKSVESCAEFLIVQWCRIWLNVTFFCGTLYTHFVLDKIMPISQVNRWKASAGTSVLTREINIAQTFQWRAQFLFLFFFIIDFFIIIILLCFLRTERRRIAGGTACTCLES